MTVADCCPAGDSTDGNFLLPLEGSEKKNQIRFHTKKEQLQYDNCCICDDNGKLRGKGSLSDKLYQLDCQVVFTGYASVAQSRSDLWHQRLGHVHESRLKRCIQNKFVQGIDVHKDVSKTVSHSGRDSVDA